MFGARGVGEIGVAGVAAAITAAVHHATGALIRDLPVRVEVLMAQSILIEGSIKIGINGVPVPPGLRSTITSRKDR